MADPLRVGLDYWPATTHAPGVGRYVRELVRALATLEDPPSLRLLDVGPGPRPISGAPLGLEPCPPGWRRLEADVPRGALRALAALGLPPERLLGGCDLLHGGLPGGLPGGPAPRVLALAELPAPGGREEASLRRVLEATEDLVVFSAHARALLLERFGCDAERVHALPVGCDHWTRDARARDALEAPLVLALGRTDVERAPLVLLRAFELLAARDPEVRLVLCGRPGSAAAELRAAIGRSRFRARLRWIEAPVERDLPALVASTAVLAHLAPGELSPVTPLEAMAFGAAVLASPEPAFREALGEAACWTSPDPAAVGVEELAARLERAVAAGLDPSARASRRALAAGWTWRRHAALTAALWRRILARSPG